MNNTSASTREESKHRTPIRRRRRRWYSSATYWAILIALTAGAGAHAAPGAWFATDLVANLSAQFLLATGVMAVYWLFRRRWGFVLGAGVLGAVHSVFLCAYRCSLTDLAEVDGGWKVTERVGAGVVRVYHMNASRQATLEELKETLDEYGADVVHITEPTAIWPRKPNLFPYAGREAEVRNAEKRTRKNEHGEGVGGEGGSADGGNGGGGPWVMFTTNFWAQREAGNQEILIGDSLLASRWPMEAYEVGEESWVMRALIAARVKSPMGEFVVIAMHPHSPRDAERWLVGNEIVQGALRVAERARGEGYGVVILADLNSTPTGWRSRELGRKGYRRCKPLGVFAGTWPTGKGAFTSYQRVTGHWPMQIAIDDAWIDERWECVAWSRTSPHSSDHWGVVADVRIVRPNGAGGASGESVEKEAK